MDDLSTIENKAHQGRNGWIVEHRGCLCVCREEKKNQNWPLANEIKIGKKKKKKGGSDETHFWEKQIWVFMACGLPTPPLVVTTMGSYR